MPPAAPPPELLALPHYADFRPLGGGGMGVVFLARNTLLDRREVLKVISKELLKKPGARDRFLREMRAAARLGHPNVVAAYAAIAEGDFLALAMEYVPGRDLHAVVEADGPLHFATAAAYARQAALGLQHAHERDMVHRDIKPANLMLSRGTIKILDFGLAKVGSDADARLTQSGALLGTPAFLAPEQSLDAAKAGIRADLYSLGCTLYYLITGEQPYSGASAFSVLQAHLTAAVPDVRAAVPAVPAPLAEIIRRLMAKAPADRYDTPADVAAALEPFAGVVPTELLPAAVETVTGFDFPTEPARPPSAVPAVKPKRHPAWYAVPAVAVLALLGGIIAFAGGGKKPAEPGPVAKQEPTLNLPAAKKPTVPTPAPADEVPKVEPTPVPTPTVPEKVEVQQPKAAPPQKKTTAPTKTTPPPAAAEPAIPARKTAPAWKNVVATQADIKSNKFKLPDASKLPVLPCDYKWKAAKNVKQNESFYVPRALESGDMVQLTGRSTSLANLNWWGFLIGDDNAGWLAVYVSNAGTYTTGPWPGNNTEYRLKNPPKDYPKVAVAAHKAIQAGTLPNSLTLLRRNKLLEVYINEVGVGPPVAMPATLGTEVWIQMDVQDGDSFPGYSAGPTFRDARDFETPFVKRP